MALSASLAFFVVFAATMGGILGVDKDYLLLAKVLGFTRRKVFTHIIVPAAVPSIFTGLELGIIYGMLGTVAGEMISGNSGLGVRLQLQATQFDTNGYFATLALLVIVTVAITAVLRLLRSRLLRWHRAHIIG